MDGPLKPHAEGVIVDGLEHKIQRPHLVPADGILGHIGHEHQHHVLVAAAQLFCGFHAVQAGHLDIQQDNVKAGGLLGDDLAAVGKAFHLKLRAVLPAVTVDIFFQLLAAALVILNNGNAQSGPSFSRRRGAGLPHLRGMPPAGPGGGLS